MEKNILDKHDIQIFLENLDNSISENMTIFLIGGCAMSLKGLKAATIDIDIVLTSKKEFKTLKPAILNLGYGVDEEKHDINAYKQAIMVFLKETSRVDIFIKNIVGMLDFTKTMEKRSELFSKYNNLTVMLASNEDIFLLKSLSDREKDLPDMKTLIESGLDWKAIIKECISQHRKETKWVFWLYEQICRVEEEFDLTIPEKNRIFKVCRDNWSKRPSDFMHDIENVEKHIPKQYLKDI